MFFIEHRNQRQPLTITKIAVSFCKSSILHVWQSSKYAFIHKVLLILWKSDNPDSVTSYSRKDFRLFVIITSMQAAFAGFLKQVLSLTIFLQPHIWQNVFIETSLGFKVGFTCTYKSVTSEAEVWNEMGLKPAEELFIVWWSHRVMVIYSKLCNTKTLET